MIVGLAGSGNVAAAMARGWASADGGPEQLLFTDSGSGRAQALASEVGGEVVGSNLELAERAELLVLAVKPGALEAVAGETQAAAAILSMLGGTSLERVSGAYPGASVFRLMPNLGVEVRRGVLCFAPAPEAPAELRERVRALLEPLGRVVDLDDGSFDAATAVMACSPAYLALAIEAIADSGVADGLDDELSRSLVVEAAAGTAELLRQRQPAELRRAVASPGGSTEAGLEVLERRKVGDAFAEAVRASLARMRG